MLHLAVPELEVAAVFLAPVGVQIEKEIESAREIALRVAGIGVPEGGRPASQMHASAEAARPPGDRARR
jgi:hypothetical protein